MCLSCIETCKFSFVKQIKKRGTMKKFLMLGVMALSCQLGHSQYQPGDYYQEDGLDCVIIKVDEDGQSGLVMTLPGQLPNVFGSMDGEIDTSSVKRMLKSAIEISRGMGLEYMGRLSQRAAYVSPFYDKLGPDGQENLAVVKNMARQAGVDFAYYFPEYALMEDLGDGWFLPGMRELGYFAEIVEDSLYIPHKEYWNRLLTLNYKMPEESRRVVCGGFVPFRGHVNKMLLDFVDSTKLSGTLAKEWEKHVRKADAKANDRMRGFASSMPFSFDSGIKCSTLDCTPSGWYLTCLGVVATSKGYKMGFRRVSMYQMWCTSATCAVKRVEF